MKEWIQITDKAAQRDLLHSFRQKLGFQASTKEFPGILEPVPSFTYQISWAYQLDQATFREVLADFQKMAVKAFRHCTEVSQCIYATDVYHYNYRFYPHVRFPSKNEDEWEVPIFPNGEYSIFGPRNFSWGLFGHPWEQTICIFGNPLVEAFKIYRPKLFRELIRQDGKIVNKPGPKAHAG